MRYVDPFADPNRFIKAYYVYNLTVASLAGDGTATDSVVIQADSLFVWTKATMFGAIASAIQTDSSRVVPLVTVQLTDQGSGRQFFDAQTPIPNLFGTGEIPFILPYPYHIAANSTLSASFTNLVAATTYTDIYLSLIGYRVYEKTKAAGIQ